MSEVAGPVTNPTVNHPIHPLPTAVTTPRSSSCPTLPLEIQFAVLDIPISKYHSSALLAYKRAADVLPLLLVCKTWYHYGRQQIYRCLSIGRAFQYFKLAKHLNGPAGQQIGPFVKELILYLDEKKGCKEVLESGAIQQLFKACRRVRTVDVRCYWIELGDQSTVWNELLLKAMRVYANPVTFRYNDPSSSSFTHISGLLEINFFQPFKNLQRLDLYIDPHRISLAVALSKQRIPHLNIRIYLRIDDQGHIDYTLTDPNNLHTAKMDDIVCPWMFFEVLVRRNVEAGHGLKRLDIVSRQYLQIGPEVESRSEEAIKAWIKRLWKTSAVQASGTAAGKKAQAEQGAPEEEKKSLQWPEVTFCRQYPNAKEFGGDWGKFEEKIVRWPKGQPQEYLKELHTIYVVSSDHESDADPSDSEWEQDTRLPVKLSNRRTDGKKRIGRGPVVPPLPVRCSNM
ncbi:hypothetical protein BDZ91DRAFT_851160 [Kalaharituber pfeilii]|nr:hypothetical protein BDZ91DRAFT_851160 [Kalaharituber pfeilii]